MSEELKQKVKEALENKELRKQRRKHLDERLHQLISRVISIDQELKELDDPRYFRVCIFGSARIKENTEQYNQVFELAKILGRDGIDVLSGGGPGLMEAANKGAKLGRQENRTKSLSFGIGIQLQWEERLNDHVDIKKRHYRFSSRLDEFMRLSHAVVCTPGGIGTLLELFFTWQLIQVGHIPFRPVILLNSKFWNGLIDWVKKEVYGRELVSPEDFDMIHVVDTPEEAYQIIAKEYAKFKEERGLE